MVMAPKKGLIGKDAFARMNYLHQASKLCSTFTSKRSQDLAAYYGSVFTNVAKKAVIRAEPDIKRNFCKGCNTFLVPGENVRIRLKKNPAPRLIHTCLRCFTLKRFGVRDNYMIWTDREEAVVETKIFSNKAVNLEKDKPQIAAENPPEVEPKPAQCSVEQSITKEDLEVQF